jgi:antitoxin component HigA of HigAB toxin-antitoxin module
MEVGLESILKLRVFEDRYPFPQSKKYAEIIEFIRNNLVDYSFIWTVLVVWNDLRLLGKLITSEPAYAEISRSWLDEWGLSRHVDGTIQGMGFDAGQAHSAVTILKLLVSQQGWTNDLADQTAAGLMEKWLGNPEVRSFLGINRHRDVLWFNKEAFESMMWWMMTIGLLDQVSRPNASLTEAVETLFDAYGLIQEILDAEEGSDYQVERLLEGLK